MRVMNAFVIAFSTYSRIPMPCAAWSQESRRYAMCFFPLVGALVGLLLWGWLALCDALGVGPVLRGTAGALIPLLVTGGIHMDGLMDVSDALASWQPPEQRLEILKDSHAGAFAVMACAGYLLLTAGLLSEADAADGRLLAPCFVLSRAMSAAVLTVMRSARPGGMLDGFARAAHRRAVCLSSGAYAALCAVLWLVLGGPALSGACLLAAALCALGFARMAQRQFGGITGDLAGWLVQAAELCLTAVIVMGGMLK
ncbi:MAG: adenosylcobinamide-GDP ribazoletransferase [Candidatus Ventricola sp.]